MREDTIKNKVGWVALWFEFFAILEILVGVVLIWTGAAKGKPILMASGVVPFLISLPGLAIGRLLRTFGCIDCNTKAANQNIMTLCKIAHECLKASVDNKKATERVAELMTYGSDEGAV